MTETGDAGTRRSGENPYAVTTWKSSTGGTNSKSPGVGSGVSVSDAGSVSQWQVPLDAKSAPMSQPSTNAPLRRPSRGGTTTGYGSSARGWESLPGKFDAIKDMLVFRAWFNRVRPILALIHGDPIPYEVIEREYTAYRGSTASCNAPGSKHRPQRADDQ